MRALKPLALSVLLLESTLLYVREGSAETIASGNDRTTNVKYECTEKVPRRRICDFHDTECLSKAAVRCYPTCIGGGPGWEASIPFIDCGTIDRSILPSLTQTLSNVTLSGMDTCSPTLVELMPETNDTFVYHVLCSQITLDADLKANGTLCSKSLEGQGHYKIVEKGFLFIFTGVYSEFYDKNNERHIKIERFKMHVENKEESACENKTSISDNEKSYWNLIDDKIKNPILATCLTKFIGNTNDFIIYTPLIDYFYYIDD